MTILALDLRSLALLRVMLGLFTLADIVERSFDLHAHYTDAGIVPRAAAAGPFNAQWTFSLHMASGDDWWIALLFAVAAVAGLALAAGYRTRLATVLCWILTMSLHTRNDGVLEAADTVHRLLLFWSMFLPLGEFWSVDRLLRGGAGPRSTSVRSVGAAALMLQMAAIFWMAALLKTGDPWRKDFTAVWYTLQWDVFVFPLGIWLRQFTGLLKVLTVATLVLEGIVPFLLFTPWPALRTATVASFVGLHLGLALCMRVEMFSAVMIAGWLALLPGWFWDRGTVSRSSAAFDRGPAQRFALICLLYVAAWNARSLFPEKVSKVFGPSWNFFGMMLRLDQSWSMFAPSPVNEDGWFVIPARLTSGKEVDLYRDGAAPVDWSRPPSIANSYRDRRWRIYLWRITRFDGGEHRKQYAHFVCRDWEARHGDDPDLLQSYELVLMYEKINPDLTILPARKLPLWEHQCH